MKYAEYLTKARDHHQRVGNYVGAYYANDDEANAPCCMLGALRITTYEPGVEMADAARRFYELYQHLFGQVRTVTGDYQVGDFSDGATDEERLAMWNRAIQSAPDRELP